MSERNWNIRAVDPKEDSLQMQAIKDMLESNGQYDEILDGDAAMKHYRLIDNMGAIIVAECVESRRVLGTIRASFCPVATLARLFVDEAERGQGIGKDLLRSAIGYGKLQGVKRFILHVDEDNTVREMYARMEGYVEYADITHGELDTEKYTALNLFPRDEESSPENLQAFNTVAAACALEPPTHYVFGQGVTSYLTGLPTPSQFHVPTDYLGLTDVSLLPPKYEVIREFGSGYDSWAKVPVECHHERVTKAEHDAMLGHTALLAYYSSSDISGPPNTDTITKLNGIYIMREDNRLLPFHIGPTEFYSEIFAFGDGLLNPARAKQYLQKLRRAAAVIKFAESNPGYFADSQ